VSITIGFGYSVEESADIYDELKALAEKFGYGLLNGIEYSEEDVRSGLEIAQKTEGWEQLVFLQSPPDREVSLAFGIHEELTAHEVPGKHPQFFDFLKEFIVVCSRKCAKLGIFFSGDWYENTRVRYSLGTVDDLIVLLSMPGHWGIRYLIPATGDLQFSDEIPLIFDLKLK
jgi:hypothetical protein